ncbi:MAG: hypothetical protein DBX55_01505 [Verrucomicrobia bacterium]|nr:MAG: hypothetical protein DBX55_01505 [Verrucomicrobiota bacterium]
MGRSDSARFDLTFSIRRFFRRIDSAAAHCESAFAHFVLRRMRKTFENGQNDGFFVKMVDERQCREVNCARYIFAFKTVFWNPAGRNFPAVESRKIGLF